MVETDNKKKSILEGQNKTLFRQGIIILPKNLQV